MNYNGVDLSIMRAVQNGSTNGSNTLANLKGMFGDSSVINLISNGHLSLSGSNVNLTMLGEQAMTPVDLSENADLNSDSSSSLLHS